MYVIACGLMAEPRTCWRRPPSGYSGRVLLLCVKGIVVHAQCALASVYIEHGLLKSRLNMESRLKPLVIISEKLRNRFKGKCFRHHTRVLVRF